MKPSPNDVLRALDGLKPGAMGLVLGPHRNAQATALRRVAVAVCVSMGWSMSRIGRDFHRDHTTIMSHRDTYLRNMQLGGKPDDAALFRALIPAAHTIAGRRGVLTLADYRRRAA